MLVSLNFVNTHSNRSRTTADIQRSLSPFVKNPIRAYLTNNRLGLDVLGLGLGPMSQVYFVRNMLGIFINLS